MIKSLNYSRRKFRNYSSKTQV